MRRWLRRWRYPMTSEAVEMHGYRFRITWSRSPLTHRRGPIVGIEKWSPPRTEDGAYGYTVWKK